MSTTTHRNERIEHNKNRPTTVNGNGVASNRTNGHGHHANGIDQQQQQKQHHHQPQPQRQPQQPPQQHQPPTHHSAIARIKSESLNGAQKLMVGVPPAVTPIQHRADACANGDKPNDLALQHEDGQVPQPAGSEADAKGKARELDPIRGIPIEQLEQELPLEEADLVPLAALVERLANHGYEALQNLAETLPSLPSSSRRAKIFSTALDVRKQFIKLLVLVRWTKDISDLQKSRNIISLLSEQQWQNEDVFAGLTDIRKILPNARMRNADLPTAIDVLRTGSYRRLPTSIKDLVVPPQPFTDEEAVQIVAQLDDALRLRMACREIVPAPMTRYRIHDGKVHFRVAGLFETVLTASGSGRPGSGSSAGSADFDAASADRWWLLDLKFDIRISGSNSEAAIRIFPRKPRKAYRERLRVWGDHELEPRSVDPAPDAGALEQQPTTQGNGEAVEGTEVQQRLAAGVDEDARGIETAPNADVAEQQLGTNTKRDAPLVRLYAFLQERSLHYQMDVLQYQAMQLTRLNWGSNLRIEMQERPRSLVLHYWNHAQSGVTSGQGSTASGPAQGGSVRIAVADQAGNLGKRRLLADLLENGIDDATNSVEDGGKAAGAVTRAGEGETPFLIKRRHIQVSWEVDQAIKDEAGTVELTVSPLALDLEQLLTRLVQTHASAMLRVLRKRILTSKHSVSKGLLPQDCRVCTAAIRHKDATGAGALGRTARSEYLHIDLIGSSRRERHLAGLARPTSMPPLRLKVDAVSGRMQLEAQAEATASVPGSQRHQVPRTALVTSLSAGSLAPQHNSARLNEASDRINASVDALLDALQRLEIFARVEEWERRASYIGLRAVRKLNFKPAEYAKFGPSLATCGAPALYLPLGPRFASFYLALQPSEATGVNVALISATQVMEGPGTTTMVLHSIEWLDRVRIARASLAPPLDAIRNGPGLGKRKPSDLLDESTIGDSTVGTGDLTLEELASLHSYSVALVAYFRVEQQLRARAVPYLHVRNFGTRSRSAKSAKVARLEMGGKASPLGDDDENDVGTGWSQAPESDLETGASSLVPTLCLRTVDLLGPAEAHLAKRNVSLRVRDWWVKDRIRAEISIRLRMRSRRFKDFHKVVDPPLQPDSGLSHRGQNLMAAGGGVEARSWLGFDARTSILTYSTPDLDNCVLGFLAEWQKISPAIELAREVLNVGRGLAMARAEPHGTPSLPELKEFDFGSVTFAYGQSDGPGQADPAQEAERASGESRRRRLLVRVRWQEPKVATYQFASPFDNLASGCLLDFGSYEPDSAATATEAWFGGLGAEANPHNAVAQELRRAINAAAASHPLAERSHRVWRGFFQLLRDTLPVVRELQPLLRGCLDDAECPELEIRSATWFRVQFLDKYALDIRLTTHSRFLLCDASQPLFRSPTKSLDALPAAPSDGLFTLSTVASLADPSPADPHDRDWTRLQSTGQYLAIPRFPDTLAEVCARAAPSRDATTLVHLRRALLCSADEAVVGTVLPHLLAAIRSQLRSPSSCL